MMRLMSSVSWRALSRAIPAYEPSDPLTALERLSPIDALIFRKVAAR
jgi:hypothetical protein